jgi:hypothetical protein
MRAVKRRLLIIDDEQDITLTLGDAYFGHSKAIKEKLNKKLGSK